MAVSLSKSNATILQHVQMLVFHKINNRLPHSATCLLDRSQAIGKKMRRPKSQTTTINTFIDHRMKQLREGACK